LKEGELTPLSFVLLMGPCEVFVHVFTVLLFRPLKKRAAADASALASPSGRAKTLPSSSSPAQSEST